MKAPYSVLCLLFFSPYILTKVSCNFFDYVISGYIKGEAYTDSRQTVDAQVVDQPFFPKKEELDPVRQDINARAQTVFDAFETRIGIDFYNIIIKDAKLRCFLQVDFEVFFLNTTNLPHLRHAYGTLDWKNIQLLFGQTWHPIVFIEPKTINYNGSSPFDYYARSPQVTLTYHTPVNIDIISSASMQVDFVSDGPFGLTNQYMSWAIIPNFDLQIRWLLDTYIMNIGIDYKRIAPRIQSNTHFKVHERLSALTFFWYAGFKWRNVELNTKINIGQNASDFSGLGGYAVKKGSINPISDKRQYTNFRNLGWWVDIEITKNKKIKPGLFIGFAKNLGTSSPIENDIVDKNIIVEKRIFGFVPDVNNAFRISPRVVSDINKITLAGEVEYTRAGYGEIINNGSIVNIKPVESVRCTFAAYYFF